MDSRALTVGSLGSIAKRDNISLAESFLAAEMVVIVDVSSSMENRDSRGGQSRYSVACSELAALQRTMPGKIAVIAFASVVEFVPGGIPPNLGGGTNLADALRFARAADVSGMRFIVISDGQPDSESDALSVARTYANRIDCIFVGPERDQVSRNFLTRLATASGGQSVLAKQADKLAAAVEQLLLQKGA